MTKKKQPQNKSSVSPDAAAKLAELGKSERTGQLLIDQMRKCPGELHFDFPKIYGPVRDVKLD